MRQNAGSGLWQLAFRPFFLLGSAHATLALALWVGFVVLRLPLSSAIDPMLWHPHEMIFGFATAIVAGFVMTAAQNWTGIRGMHGAKLKALVLLWAIPRALVLVPGVPPAFLAGIDLCFLPAVAWALVPYLRDPDLKAEKAFFVFFALLFAGNAMVHLEATGLRPGWGRVGLYLGLDTILVVIVFMGGRVIPFFTESSVARAQPRTWPWVEVASHVSAALFLAVDPFFPSSWAAAGVGFAASAIHATRLWGWQVPRVRRIPLVWVLHLAYLWLAAGFLLSGFASLGWFPKSLATHAFTIGCVSTIIYGMISRVSLGHTGRRLHPTALTAAGYWLLAASAAGRVLGPSLFPAAYATTIAVSGGLWIAAFIAFLLGYSPMLLLPRVDGKPG